MNHSSIEISGRPIGSGHPCYIIAELSANHGQSIEKAKSLVRAAAESGADAIKLQTYRADTITIDCDAPPFQVGKGSAWEGRRLYNLYEEAHTPWEWHQELFDEAAAAGLHCFSSPFDATAITLLEELNAPAYKIASFEIVDHDLIRRCAETGKPLIISTGMASKEEVKEAVDIARSAGCRELSLLRCVSSYPAPPEEMNLATIQDLRDSFGCPVGLSDHTLGTAIPVAAATLGAAIIEKHLTFRRAAGGPDSHFSLEPEEFTEMIKAVREATASIGRVSYEITEAQKSSRTFRRSLFAVKDIEKGETLTHDNVRSIRPGDGLLPKYLPDVIGKSALARIPFGTPLSWDQIETQT